MQALDKIFESDLIKLALISMAWERIVRLLDQGVPIFFGEIGWNRDSSNKNSSLKK